MLDSEERRLQIERDKIARLRAARLASEATRPKTPEPLHRADSVKRAGPTHRSRVVGYLEENRAKGMTADEGVQRYEADVNDGRPLGNIVPQLLSQMEKEGEVVVIGFRPTRRGKNASVYALRKYANAGTGQV